MNDGIKAGMKAVWLAFIGISGFMSIVGIFFLIGTLLGEPAMWICILVASIFALGVANHYDGGGLQ